MGPTILAITILFAVCVTYNTAIVKTYVWAERRPFCGSDLADMIQTMCPRGHEYDYEEEPKVSDDDITPADLVTGSRRRRGIVDECCVYPGCTPLYIRQNYCRNKIRADTSKPLIVPSLFTTEPSNDLIKLRWRTLITIAMSTTTTSTTTTSTPTINSTTSTSTSTSSTTTTTNTPITNSTTNSTFTTTSNQHSTSTTTSTSTGAPPATTERKKDFWDYLYEQTKILKTLFLNKD